MAESPEKLAGRALAEARQGLPAIVERAEALKIESEADLAVAAESIAIASKLERALEAERKEETGPLMERKKEIDTRYAAIKEKLSAIVGGLKIKILDFQREEAKKRAAEEARLAEERKAAEEAKRKEDEASGLAEDPLDLPPWQRGPGPVGAPSSIVKTASGALHTRKRWVYIIADESQIPREFLTPNSVKINEAIRLGAREIPGLKIEEREEVIAR